MRGVAIAVLGMVAAFQADAGEIRQGACYRADLPRAGGPLRSITARRDKTGVLIQFTEWDAPNVRFIADASCRSQDARFLHCFIDCDGGSVDLALTPDGRLSLFTGRLRTNSAGLPSRLILADEADGGDLSGLYFLSEVNSPTCDPAGETYAVPLGPGDDTPAVASAERLLNDLGFLLEKPSNVYTGRTAEAVRRFQAAYGLPETGMIDAATAHKLVAALSAGGGGC